MQIDIYGTLGPACRRQETMEKMFAAGMTGMRLNLSHTGLAGCRDWLESYRRAAERVRVSSKLLIDLQGPELRVGDMEPAELVENTVVELKQMEGGPAGNIAAELSAAVTVELSAVPGAVSAAVEHSGILVPAIVLQHLKPGQQILLDDGKILLEVKDLARCRVLRGGLLKGRKSIALPGQSLHPPTLTESDFENLRLAKACGVTGVMLPFVRDAEDLITLRKTLKAVNAEDIRIFAKIENMDGRRKLPSLLPYADEIVIARGDLGNDMPLWELPGVQYEIGNQCKAAGKPYMVVTQMLASMEHAAVPTRAEVSDIFYAVLHGAASVMLTGETAAGSYPVEAMEYMCRTVGSALRLKEGRA